MDGAPRHDDEQGNQRGGGRGVRALDEPVIAEGPEPERLQPEGERRVLVEGRINGVGIVRGPEPPTTLRQIACNRRLRHAVQKHAAVREPRYQCRQAAGGRQ